MNHSSRPFEPHKSPAGCYVWDCVMIFSPLPSGLFRTAHGAAKYMVARQAMAAPANPAHDAAKLLRSASSPLEENVKWSSDPSVCDSFSSSLTITSLIQRSEGYVA